MRVQLDIPDDIYAEVQYLVELHTQHGAPNPQRSVEDLLAYLASAVAEGSRRPGAWERGLLMQMGLVPEAGCETYRAQYGRPTKS